VTAFDYHPYYARVRSYQVDDFGFAAGWVTFQRLSALGRSSPSRSFLVDAGDRFTEATHKNAKAVQSDGEYTRERLRRPRFTYAEEQQQLIENRAEHFSHPFLELVMATDQDLPGWWRRPPGSSIRSCSADPMDLHCHTPLNQRLLPLNMRICQVLVEALADLDAEPWAQNLPLRAAACLARLALILGLDHEEITAVTAFGRSYLAQYLEWPGSSQESIERRTAQVASVADRFGIAASYDARELLDGLPAALGQSHGFFFPESLWMQFHWLTSSLGVPLGQEMALAEALDMWARRQSLNAEP
jgi:hypothetical protein